MMIKKIFFSTASLLAYLLSAQAQDTITFRIKFNVGDRFEISSSSTNVMQMTVGESITKDSAITQLEVISTTSDNITFSVLPILRVSSTQIGKIIFKYDSNTPDWLNLYNKSTAFALAQNIPYTAKMTPTGYVFEVNNTENLIKRIKDASKSLNKKTRAKWTEEMLYQTEKSALTASWANWDFLYPDHPIKIGDSWSDTRNPLDSSRTNYLLKAETDSSYLVECTGSYYMNVEFEIDKKPQKMIDKRTYTRQIELSKKTFFIISEFSNTAAETEMTMPLNSQEETTHFATNKKNIFIVKPLKNE